MLITILTDEFKVLRKGITPREATKIVDCTLTTVYQASLRGYKINNYYIVRSYSPQTINLVLVKAVKSLAENADQDGVKLILQNTIKQLRGLDDEL